MMTPLFSRRRWLIGIVAALLLSLAASARAEGWQAGAAKVNITPQQPMWMSGYGDRDRPAEGTLTELWAKALVLQDPQGVRAVLITLDLCGIDRELSQAVCGQIQERHGLVRQHIAICCSHTHTGPVVAGNLAAMYFLDETQQQLVDDYAVLLQENIIAAADQAFQALAPAVLHWGEGRAGFAVNRRTNVEAQVPAMRETGQLNGPVDHDVPVLRVADAEGRIKAIVLGYACHATVLSFFQWSGDYPGFAQLALEEAHPGAVALFWAGCGGDQNPLPRRTVELAQHYGGRLAAAVEEVLAGPMRPIEGVLTAEYQELELPLAELPARAQIEAEAASSNRYAAHRAQLLLAQIEAGQPLTPHYPYPVQSWRLGPELLFITLGGEVVVDYALRLKSQLGDRTWVAGYANDVMAYIPSRRVLQEGGYEGGGAMVYYGLPTVWAPEVEDLICAEADRQAAATAQAP